jgi:hypothetical protein
MTLKISISSCPAGASTYDTENGGMLIPVSRLSGAKLPVYSDAVTQVFENVLEPGQPITLGELHDLIK